jgi:HSP20 family protein
MGQIVREYPVAPGLTAVRTTTTFNRSTTMTIARYIPQSTLAGPLNELMSGFFGRDIDQFFGSDDVNPGLPRVNVLERGDAFELRMLAPGFSKQELKLNIEDDTLTVSGEKKTEELKENERYTRREFGIRSFSRGFRLPPSVSVDGITAEHVDGVLHVRLPKTEAAKPKSREIGIG